ncbi:MAG: hypothetical protein KME60_28990 [Cyanomargarita calcarea GSE-NOS-MK-12-04C]|jgi:WD40 repeat protein|uniref:WD40 repeat-containing protein n=1 Tax=Cyanomargarita calcarea GSE-NOS-MK-12-04C TaxID=2839659 RepID=A0A951QRX9_9CYAN|nr:hypothetical protein [Cyanomargarita calcarea GSE-NOS-MK-12-04C]
MENNIINASASPQSHTFRPGGSSVSFKVIVSNDSDRFADFQLEVLAAGADPSLGHLWYRLSPEISAAKPPGSSTEFQIVIFNSPIPGFVGTANLTIRIFSPLLRQERRLLVRLKIETDDRAKQVNVDLPVRQFQVYPRNVVDIPVRVRNLSQQPVDVVLHFVGIEPSWLNGGAERRLLVQPGTQSEVIFTSEPPSTTQALSREYPFTIECISSDGYPSTTQGTLEVLPIGFVEFTATPPQQTIPLTGGWLPNWQSKSASFQLLFKNASNLQQQVDIQLQGKDHRKCTYNVSPKDAELDLGEITKVILEVKTKRPWIGWLKTLQFDAKASLSDQRLGSTDPTSQALELRVFPMLPLWLQLALIALLALLLGLLFRPEAIAHTDAINAVRFSADALSAVSGSDDGTIRRWKVNGNSLEAEGDNEPQKPKGVLGDTNEEVFALRFDPVKNNRVAAGLKNSAIQLWNVAERVKEDELKVPELFGKTDKVFDLVFPQNNNRYLISGHANGKVLIWVRNSAADKFQHTPEQGIGLDYEVWSMALSRDEQTLAIAGNYKYLTLLNLNKLNSLPKNNYVLKKEDLIKLNISQGRFSVATPDSGYGNNDRIFSVAFVPQSPNLLATADSDGFITILDYQCQIGKNSGQSAQLNKPECVSDRWQVGKAAVRSIAFTPDGKKLVSAGYDGRVVVWQLTSEGKREVTSVKGEVIENSPGQLNSIDINSQGNAIVIGGNDCQLRQSGKKCQPHLKYLEK